MKRDFKEFKKKRKKKENIKRKKEKERKRKKRKEKERKKRKRKEKKKKEKKEKRGNSINFCLIRHLTSLARNVRSCFSILSLRIRSRWTRWTKFHWQLAQIERHIVGRMFINQSTSIKYFCINYCAVFVLESAVRSGHFIKKSFVLKKNFVWFKKWHFNFKLLTLCAAEF